MIWRRLHETVFAEVHGADCMQARLGAIGNFG